MDKTTFLKDFATLGLLMMAGYFWLGIEPLHNMLYDPIGKIPYDACQ